MYVFFDLGKTQKLSVRQLQAPACAREEILPQQELSLEAFAPSTYFLWRFILISYSILVRTSRLIQVESSFLLMFLEGLAVMGNPIGQIKQVGAVFRVNGSQEGLQAGI